MDKIEEVLTRGVEAIYPSKKALEKVLRSGKKIKLYQGFDPSMPNLHLGNLVGIMKLKQFQDLGHEVIFLVGDFTGMVGDPDKMSTRKPLSRKQVLANSEEWKKQAGKILNFSGKNAAKILFNSQWLSQLTFEQLLNLASHLTYQQIIKRDLFQKRIKQNIDIHLSELLYPLMQAYDSVSMGVDLEIGGSDQMFNMMMGRDLMKKVEGKEKFVLTTKLLVDAKGEKAGKTTSNALFLNADPSDMYGGVMAFPDETILLAFELLTRVSMADIEQMKKKLKAKKINPMDLKKKSAWEIVKLCHGEKEAQKAQKEFERVFQKGQKPNYQISIYDKQKEKTEKADLVSILVKSGKAGSRSEAKRLILQGGVDIDGKTIKKPFQKLNLRSGLIIRVGKKDFIKVQI